MNLLLLHREELIDGRAELRDSRADHIRKILKAEKGDTLKAGLVNGQVGRALVTDAGCGGVSVEFSPEKEPPAAPAVTLILALPRPKVFRRILFGAVSCGVKDIHIINSWRVEKSYWDSPYISPEQTDRICLEALSQSKDTIMPEITFHRFFMGFMEEGLPKIPADRKRYLAHPYGSSGESPSLPAALAVGPEGGFVEKETETFGRFGFTLFSYGERTLTTEHFVPFMLGSLIK